MADLILKGNFNQTETTTQESALIRHIQKQTDLNAIPDTITTDKWKGKIKNWSKSTSTSPSGFHLSHSKILIAPHDLNKEGPNYDEVESQCDSLIQWQVDLLNLTYILIQQMENHCQCNALERTWQLSNTLPVTDSPI